MKKALSNFYFSLPQLLVDPVCPARPPLSDSGNNDEMDESTWLSRQVYNAVLNKEKQI